MQCFSISIYFCCCIRSLFLAEHPSLLPKSTSYSNARLVSPGRCGGDVDAGPGPGHRLRLHRLHRPRPRPRAAVRLASGEQVSGDLIFSSSRHNTSDVTCLEENNVTCTGLLVCICCWPPGSGAEGRWPHRRCCCAPPGGCCWGRGRGVAPPAHTSLYPLLSSFVTG